MNLYNALGYDVKFQAENEILVPKGQQFSLNIQELPCKNKINGREVCHVQVKDSSNLPTESDNAYYLVTALFAQEYVHRKDLLTLQYNGAKRNAEKPNVYDSYPGLVRILNTKPSAKQDSSSQADNQPTDYKIVNTLAFPMTFEDGHKILGQNKNCVLDAEETSTESINGIPVVEKKFTKVKNLPEPEHNTLYVVSKIVADWAIDRTDLVSPNTFNLPAGSNNPPAYAKGYVVPAHNRRFD